MGSRSVRRGGAHLFPLMLVGAAVLFPLVTWLTATVPQAEPQVTPDTRSTPPLTAFLRDGPTRGLWEAQRLYDRRRAYFAPLAGRPDQILMAPAPTPEPSFCQTCRSPCSYTRPQVTQFFFEAPADLFMKNYRRDGPLEYRKLDDGTPAVVATWVAWRLQGTAEGPTLTSREVWSAPDTGAVLQIQDHSRAGHPIRRVWRVTASTGSWDPSTFNADSDPVCGGLCPSCRGTPAEQMARVQARAPYTIVHPTRLPPGFQLIRAVYREVPVSIGSATDVEAAMPARVATLLYSDGLALISIAMAPSDEMDVLEARFTDMREGDPTSSDTSACPTLPLAEVAKMSRPSGGVVRWRSDVCRTVARRDGIEGLSVTLLGRNEVNGDEYLEVMLSIEAYAPPSD